MLYSFKEWAKFSTCKTLGSRLSIHRKGDSAGSVRDENSVIFSDQILGLLEFTLESLVVRNFSSPGIIYHVLIPTIILIGKS